MGKPRRSSQSRNSSQSRTRKAEQHARRAAHHARQAEHHRKRAAHLGPERRRPEVLDAALGLFLEHGYDGTSMQAIADRAGVTKPVVYACFPGKDELLRALLRREEGRILEEIQSAFANSDLSDPRRTLIEGFTGFLRAVGDSPDVYRLIFLGEGGGNAAVARRIQRGREAQVDRLTALARRWVEAQHRDWSAEEVERTSRLIGNAIAGLAESGARLLLSGEDEWTPETLGRELGRFAASARVTD
jgi:AcrR family transcriptional regulator